MLPPTPPPALRRPIRGTGLVCSVHTQRLVSVRLENGYNALAHLSRAAAESLPPLQAGMEVHLEFNPYDMAHPRILPQKH